MSTLTLDNVSDVALSSLTSEISDGTNNLKSGTTVVGTITKSGTSDYTLNLNSNADGVTAVEVPAGNWTINTTASTTAKTITVSTDAGTVNTNTGKGNDVLVGLGNAAAGSRFVSSGGNNKFDFNHDSADGYTDEAVISGDSVKGGYYVNAGGGADTVLGAKNSTVKTGAGDDSIVQSLGGNLIDVAGGDDYVGIGLGDTITLGSGKDTLSLTENTTVPGAGVVKDYKYGEDVIQVSSVTTMVGTNASAYFLSSGAVKNSTGNNEMDRSSASSYYSVTVTDGTNTQDVWYAGTKGTTMNATNSTKDLFMVGDNNGENGDYITGGSCADTIIAGTNDTVNGGKGSDSIVLTSGTTDYVVIGTSGGHDTVDGFADGYSSTSDVLYFANGLNTAKSVNADGSDVTVTLTDGTSIVLKGVSATTDGGVIAFKAADSTGVHEIGAIVNGSTVAVTGDTLRDNYTGIDAGVDFSAYEGTSLSVDLGNTGKFGSMANFNGINYVVGMGHDNNTLVGASGTNNTLVSGANSYLNSVWGGGASRDSMVGASGSYDTFFYGTGDGKDSVSGFNVAEDTLYIHSGNATWAERNSSSANDIRILWNTDDVLNVNVDTTDVDQAIKYVNPAGQTSAIKIGLTDSVDAFTYDSGVNAYYGGTQGGDILTVNTSADEKVWLDGTRGKAYVGINVLNGSSSTGNIELSGSGSSDTIIGGAGKTSLWGGAGAVGDTMVGGSGYNEFYFGMADGNDVITSSNDSDKVMLYNVSSADIASGGVDGNGNMVVTLKDGSSLTLQNYASSGATTFQATDATFVYDKEANAWK